MKLWKQSRNCGFSQLEVLVTVAVIGILAGISVVLIVNINDTSREAKLDSDVQTLNRAIAAYVGSGGSVDDVSSAGEMLSRLRKFAGNDEMKRIPGFAGSFTDSRVSIKDQSVDESKSGELRAYWDSTEKRFITAKSGGVGIKEFFLDETKKDNNETDDSRDNALLYAKDGNWIWDYEEPVKNAPAAPTTVAVTSPASPITSPVPVSLIPPSGPTGPAALGSLLPPLFSVNGGNYDITRYDMTVSLNNPNDSSISRLYYSVDYGPWLPYSTPLTVSPDSVVAAQSVSTDSDWADSAQVNNSYGANSVMLSPPVIIPSHDSFGFVMSGAVSVSLSDLNSPGKSTPQYRVDGGPWTDYNGPFILTGSDHPSGATIESRALPAADYYTASNSTARSIGTSSIDLAGAASGSFENPTGGDLMVTNLSGGGSSDYFEWGDITPKGVPEDATVSKSWLSYTGSNFDSVIEGERFQIGTFDYYNGSVWADTGADSVDLTIGLGLDINGTYFNPEFDFTFDLINTENAYDPLNPWPDADYVSINDYTANQTLVIDGYEYQFSLEFGETTANGFSLFDEFHVLEQKSASVNTYGTFTRIGLADESTLSSAIEPIYQDNLPTNAATVSNLANQVSASQSAAQVMEQAVQQLYAEFVQKYAAGELSPSEANDLAKRIQAASEEVGRLTGQARSAASRAKIKAAELSTLAESDPSLQTEADQAIASAQNAEQLLENTEASLNEAESASSEAKNLLLLLAGSLGG